MNSKDVDINIDVLLYSIKCFISNQNLVYAAYAVICLYRIIEYSVLGKGIFSNSRVAISRDCKSKNHMECVPLVSVLQRSRNSFAHCNSEVLNDFRGLVKYIVSIDEDDFVKRMYILVGDNLEKETLHKLYSSIVNIDLIKYINDVCKYGVVGNGKVENAESISKVNTYSEQKESVLDKFEYEMKQALNSID